MVGIRVNRLELDEAWSFVGKKQKNVLRNELFAKGDPVCFHRHGRNAKGNHRLARRQTER